MSEMKVGDVVEHVHSKDLYLVVEVEPGYVGVMDLRMSTVFFEKDDYLLAVPVHNTASDVTRFRTDLFDGAMKYSRALLKSSERHCYWANLALGSNIGVHTGDGGATHDSPTASGADPQEQA